MQVFSPYSIIAAYFIATAFIPDLYVFGFLIIS